jgi:DNA-binding transcriptional MocR family regulator
MDDKMMLDLKAEGKSLRQIAAALGVSHTTVMRRFKEMDQMGLPGIVTREVTGNRKCNTKSIPYPSRLCGESDETGNRLSHKNTPSHTPTVKVSTP